MNQAANNDDLQKAIADITKSTNSDPVFADTVATPNQPAPTPAPTPNPIPRRPHFHRAPAPAAPVAPAPIPEPVMPNLGTMPPTETTEKVETKVEETISETDAPIEPVAENDAPKTEISQVKEAALRDLAPLLDKMDVEPEKKFDLYKNIIEDLHDSSVVPSAYETAKNLSDEKERGEALLYIIDTIDSEK